MKAYDSNANASVEGGRTKERKGRESSERKSEKERAKGWVVAAVNGARERGREKPRR